MGIIPVLTVCRYEHEYDTSPTAYNYIGGLCPYCIKLLALKAVDEGVKK